MYAVSNAYIASMAADLREMPSFAVVLYNADVSANAALSFSFDPEPLQTGRGLNSFNRIPSSVPRATLERNWLKANGQYSALDTCHYIGARLSNAEANADGLYEYSEPDIVVVSSPGSSKPLSFVLDSAVAAVEITHIDGTIETVALSAGDSKRVLAISDSEAGDLSLKFLASFYPCRRPRVYGIYAADVFNWDCEDIVDISFEDENDLMCLELPGRSVKLLINNLDRKLNPHSESMAPTFQRKATQAMLTFSYAGELVPIGRLFLDTYTVDEETITFSFGWATLPLGDSTYSLSVPSTPFLYQRMDEIFEPDPSGMVSEYEENTAAAYAISVEAGNNIGMFTNMPNPYPVADRATCLQLLCNATGMIMRPSREKDIMLLQKESHVARRIGYEELLAEPQYTSQEEIHGISVVCYSYQEETTVTVEGAIVHSDVKTRLDLPGPSENSAGFSPIYDDNGTEIGTIGYLAQGHVAYAWCEMYDSSAVWSQQSESLEFLVKKVQKSAVDYGVAPRKKIDNPLINADVCEQLQPGLLQQLAQNAAVTIKHRGFPELDCGDLVEIQLENGGEYVSARVIENKWQFKSGVLTGTTKLRLPKGVG